MNCSTATEQPGSVKSTILKLRHLVDGLFRSFGRDSHPLPELSTMDEVRDFCEGISVKPMSHPWFGLKGVLTPRQFTSLGHSLFLFRKVIPRAHDKGKGVSYVRSMCRESAPTDPAFLEFVRREMPKLLEEGWDRSYRSRVHGMTLSTSGCLEGKRKEGGARTCNGSLKYLQGVARGDNHVSDPDLRARVSVVRENGKDRVVTVSSVEQFALRPLHDTLFGYLTSKEWLLHGDAKPNKFSGFCRKEGEVFVSGDYESATDNINLDLYREVLKQVFLLSREIPYSVYSLAQKRSSLLLESDGTERWQRRGQLMGNFLSFPILCIINYLTFKYNVPRDVPVKINGDDIVFRGTQQEAKEWKEGVRVAGLVISEGKTSVDRRFFTLNSCLFEGVASKVRVVPFVRSKALFNSPDTISGLAGQYGSICPGFSGENANFFRIYFLSKNRKLIGLSQRSLTRGLGMYVPKSVLSRSSLSRREKFYLSLPDESPLPGDDPVARVSHTPVGFTPLRRTTEKKGEWDLLRQISQSFGKACLLYARIKPKETKGISKRELVERFVRRLQKGTRAYRDLEGNYFTWLHIGVARVDRPTWEPYIPRQRKELILLPTGEKRVRLGLGYKTNFVDLA